MPLLLCRDAAYGDVTIRTNVVIPANHILLVPENATLTISAGNTLTNHGTVANFGAINHGDIYGLWIGVFFYIPTANINLSVPPFLSVPFGVGWNFADDIFTIQSL